MSAVIRVNGKDEQVGAATVAELLAARGIDRAARRRGRAQRRGRAGARAGPRPSSRRATEIEIVTPFRRRLTMAPDSTHTVTDALTIAGRSFASRLLMGSGGYPNQQVLLDSLAVGAAGAGHGGDAPHQPRSLCREPGRSARRLHAAAEHGGLRDREGCGADGAARRARRSRPIG